MTTSIAPTGAPAPPLAAAVASYGLPEAQGRLLLFVDGVLTPDETAPPHLPAGLSVTPAPAPGVAARLQVTANLPPEAPVQCLFVSTGTSTALGVLEVEAAPASAVTLLEVHVGGASGFHRAETRLTLGPGARVSHTRVQAADPDAAHNGRLTAELASGAHYALQAIALGARTSRLDLAVTLAGEGAEAHLDDLARLSGAQEAVTASDVRHAVPHTRSRQRHRLLVDDTARGTFKGRIQVDRGAQATDAAQSSRSLVLGVGARAEVLPELAIFADDVRCAHGAAIGELDADALFYLVSRGLPEPQARALLIDAFFAELLLAVATPSLRRTLTERLRHPQHPQYPASPKEASS